MKAIAAGEFHALYLTSQGHLYSCGNNDVGQLGRHQETDEGKYPGIMNYDKVFVKQICLEWS